MVEKPTRERQSLLIVRRAASGCTSNAPTAAPLRFRTRRVRFATLVGIYLALSPQRSSVN
jgi:hypothetical protein